VSGSEALRKRGEPPLYEKPEWVTVGYEGNSSSEYRSSVIASYKKILLETPCPGRNLPEDTYCFGLSGVTGLGQPEFRLATIQVMRER
jgi:hypothetical protein